MLDPLINFLVDTIGHMGYPGIVALMFLESSFFPFPSEVVIPPAGYLASKGQMNLWIVILAGVVGSLLGGIFNYWIAVKMGRPFFERWGMYFLVSEKTLQKSEVFFVRHGHISTFIGRLLPGIRQLISLPAGLARMPLKRFLTFTALGSGIWVVILAFIGYWVGNNSELVNKFLHKTTIVTIIVCTIIVIIYVWKIKNQKTS